MYIEAQSKNPGGIEGFDTPLFFEAIAQVEAQEAQAPISWRDIKVTKGQETHTLGTLIELLEHERDTALAALKSMEAQAGELSDEVIDRIGREKFGDITHTSHKAKQRQWFKQGLRYARDHYLLPSQAIGEQTAVACDYRKFECSDTGKMVNGVWVCNNHL